MCLTSGSLLYGGLITESDSASHMTEPDNLDDFDLASHDPVRHPSSRSRGSGQHAGRYARAGEGRRLSANRTSGRSAQGVAWGKGEERTEGFRSEDEESIFTDESAEVCCPAFLALHPTPVCLLLPALNQRICECHFQCH